MGWPPGFGELRGVWKQLTGKPEGPDQAVGLTAVVLLKNEQSESGLSHLK